MFPEVISRQPMDWIHSIELLSLACPCLKKHSSSIGQSLKMKRLQIQIWISGTVWKTEKRGHTGSPFPHGSYCLGFALGHPLQLDFCTAVQFTKARGWSVGRKGDVSKSSDWKIIGIKSLSILSTVQNHQGLAKKIRMSSLPVPLFATLKEWKSKILKERLEKEIIRG